MKCSHIDCDNEAKFIPEVRVPSAGNTKEYKLILSFPLCNEHVTDCRVPEVFTENVKSLFYIAARGNPTPQFERGYVVRCGFNHPAYLALQRQQRNETNSAANPA